MISLHSDCHYGHQFSSIWFQLGNVIKFFHRISVNEMQMGCLKMDKKTENAPKYIR